MRTVITILRKFFMQKMLAAVIAASLLLTSLVLGQPVQVSAWGSTPTPTPTPTVAGPSAPTGLTPSNGASVTVPFTISWSAVSDPNGIWAYNWGVSPSSSMSPVIKLGSTNGATQDTVSGLANGTYYWHVQAVSGNPTIGLVQGAWSATQSFTVTGANSNSPGTPTLNPAQGGTAFHPMEVIYFNWSAVAGADHYNFDAANDPNFPIATYVHLVTDGTSFGLQLGDSMPQGTWYVRVSAVNANGIQGVPSNVQTFTLSFNAPLPSPPTLLTPANGATVTLPITFTWTDVPNPQPMGYTIEIADDSGFKNIEFLYNQITGPAATITSLTSGTKYWRINSTQGDSAPGVAAVTAWSVTGTFVIPNTPPKMVSLAVAYDPASNGDVQTVTVQLATAAPSGGAVINLTSSNPNAAPLPATFTMPAGFAWDQFRFTVGSVPSPTPITLTASLNSTSASVNFTVLPVALKSLSVFSPMTGGVATSLTVMLNGAAPAGGMVVNLSSNSSSASPPATATIAAGDQSVIVNVPTSPVQSNTTVTLSATLNGQTVQTQLMLTPQQAPTSLTLSPNPVVGPTSSFATVTVAAAPSSDLTLPISCSNPSVATCNNAVVIPAGATTGGFNIFTVPVTTPQLVTVSVSGAGVTQTVTLTVQPNGATATATSIPSATVTPKSSATPTATPKASSTPTKTLTATNTPTATPKSSSTPTATSSSGVSLASLTLNRTSVSGGNSSTGTVTLSAPAPSGGVVVVLSSNNTSVATVPSNVTIPAGATSVTFTVSTQRPGSDTTVTISATYNGVTKTATLTVTRR